MVMGDTESCSSRIVDFGRSRVVEVGARESQKQRLKVDVYNEVLRRLKELQVAEAAVPSFEDELWAHFYRLPTRYALDMNVERAQDVLMHKRLLHMAHDPATRPAMEVRLVQVQSGSGGNCSEHVHSNSQGEVHPHYSRYPIKQRYHPPPAFGSSLDLELALRSSHIQSEDRNMHADALTRYSRPMHEITISTNDKPKLLSELTSLLSDTGLNIREAHAFCTLDKYSLDVFVVDGWAIEETQKLKKVLAQRIQKIESTSQQKDPLSRKYGCLPAVKPEQSEIKCIYSSLKQHSSGPDGEIDANLVRYERKIASGSFSDLYKGSFLDQDVAIKFFRTEHLNYNTQREFAQEVYILSQLQHKNVVNYVGACTKPPILIILTEYMSGGSMYDLIHREKAVLTLPSLLKVAIDVSEGMNYLHQNNVIHRDLKAANLLVDRNNVVKVADFGVARMQTDSGIMTAETGTYRWMAPEVIEHKPYGLKADVFSFGIVLWELLTGKIPYDNLSPLQAAVGVVQKGLRPEIPVHTHPQLVQLLERCWHKDPCQRPEFSEILKFLRHIAHDVAEERAVRHEKETSTSSSAYGAI